MRELVLNCAAELAPSWSDAMLAAGALAVSIEDADQDGDNEQALYGEPGHDAAHSAWPNSRLVVLLADGADPRHMLAVVQSDDDPVAPSWFLREVPDADWVRLTQAQFGPVAVGERVLIVPTWHLDAVAGQAPVAGRVIIRLDPGMAFGTGTHPTTAMCLRWLAEHIRGGESVLDYGCGSGILSIAASLLGAGACHAVDLDPQALVATRDNSLDNSARVQAFLPQDLPQGQYQIVVANILSRPLEVLAPLLAARVAPGGWLVLSGILRRQADELIRAYSPCLSLAAWLDQQGWVCLAGQRDPA